MTNTTISPLTYTNMLESMHGRQERKLAHNTYVRRDTDQDTGEVILEVRYHGNKIATIFSDKVVLDTCGWYTPTTQERLVWFSSMYHLNITQKNFTWYLYKRGDWKNPLGIVNGPFTIHQDGTVSGLQPISSGDQRKALIKKIKQFSRDYLDALINGQVESPSLGDCLYCQMDIPGLDHIESHMEESYFVPRLILRAIDYKPVSIMAQGAIGRVWSGESLYDFEKTILKEQGYASLWKYILHVYDENKGE